MPWSLCQRQSVSVNKDASGNVPALPSPFPPPHHNLPLNHVPTPYVCICSQGRTFLYLLLLFMFFSSQHHTIVLSFLLCYSSRFSSCFAFSTEILLFLLSLFPVFFPLSLDYEPHFFSFRPPAFITLSFLFFFVLFRVILWSVYFCSSSCSFSSSSFSVFFILLFFLLLLFMPLLQRQTRGLRIVFWDKDYSLLHCVTVFNFRFQECLSCLYQCFQLLSTTTG